MKVTITNAKAPWPEGAAVGDVVEFKGDTAPAWALGKFGFAEDGAKASFKYVPREPAETADAVAVEGMAQAQQFVDDMRTAHAAEVADLQQTISAGSIALQDAMTELDALRAKLADNDDAKAAAAIKAAEDQAKAEREAAERHASKSGKK